MTKIHFRQKTLLILIFILTLNGLIEACEFYDDASPAPAWICEYNLIFPDHVLAIGFAEDQSNELFSDQRERAIYSAKTQIVKQLAVKVEQNILECKKRIGQTPHKDIVISLNDLISLHGLVGDKELLSTQNTNTKAYYTLLGISSENVKRSALSSIFRNIEDEIRSNQINKQIDSVYRKMIEIIDLCVQ